MRKIKLPKINIDKTTVSKKIAQISFLCLVASFMFQVVTSNKYAVKGSEFVDLTNQKEELDKEISALKLEISEQSSLALVSERATQLGFTEYTNQIAVVTSSQFAVAR